MNEELFIPLYGKRDFSLVKGEGSYVWDSEENKYLDCLTGIAVNALGHCYPPVVQAIKDQTEKFNKCSSGTL